jgi:hypothetical protein
MDTASKMPHPSLLRAGGPFETTASGTATVHNKLDTEVSQKTDFLAITVERSALKVSCKHL